jgi:hypothetical protein
MGAAENKRLMQEIFEGLAEGDSKRFVESMDDGFRWTVTGQTKWSKTYEGKQVEAPRGVQADRMRFQISSSKSYEYCPQISFARIKPLRSVLIQVTKTARKSKNAPAFQ